MRDTSRDATCYNCGLPGASLRARVQLRAENSYRRPKPQLLRFCNQRCAVETMFLQLPTKSTRESITRFLGSNPVTFAEFSSVTTVEVVEDGLDRYEKASGTCINSGAEEGEVEEVTLPHIPPEFRNARGPRGRPRKWESRAEKQRAYRRRQASQPVQVSGGIDV